MQTKKLALLSTILIGLGGVALAEQSSSDATDPLLEKGPSTEATQAQSASDDDMSDQAQQALGESDAGEGMVEDGAGAVAVDEDSELESTGDVAVDAEATPGEDARMAQEGPMRSHSVATSTEPYTGEVLAGMTAEELIGMDVVDGNGEDIGSISDLLISAEGEVDRAIIDVGGFLGFGAKQVALDLPELQYDDANEAITVNVTQEQLEAMPEWQQDDQGWFSG